MSSERKRAVKSYVIRGGRLTEAQRRALDTHSEQYAIPFQPHTIDLRGQFNEPRQLVVEIGFGMGDSLLQMAQQSPCTGFIGIEVHPPGVGKLLLGISRLALTNIKVINHDANEVLQRMIKPDSIDCFLIFFPDPWHKKRHHKRRLIQTEFTELLVSRLKPGGILHLATDWEPYAEHMLEVLSTNSNLDNNAESGDYAVPGNRPATKFEKRGRRLGHGVWDLVFSKRIQV